jgi:predicted dehydrogenase
VNSPLRFGLLGCGAISRQHLQAINALGGARLTAVASRSLERAREAAREWGVAAVGDIDALLDLRDVDAVVIATPSGLHAEQAIAALRRGKHVVVEKPLSLTLADADAVVAEGRRQNLTVATISQRRFEPATQRLRAMVAGGAFGQLALMIGECLYWREQSYYDSADWRGTVALDGGVLMNQAIHIVDLMRWIGGPVSSVAAQLATVGHRMETEDTAVVTLQFAGGAVGSIIATTCAAPGFKQELRVVGDGGSVRLNGDQLVEWGLFGGPTEDPREATVSEGDRDASHAWGVDTNSYIRQYADFVEAIAEGRRPAVTAEDGRNAVQIVTAAYQAASSMTTVRLPGTR